MKRKIILYHGSTQIIRTPEYGIGNRYNDYGLGFYCTEELELAKEWACSAEADGFANKYVLKTDDLSILDLSCGKYHILNWLAILLDNWKFRMSGEIAVRADEYIRQVFLPEYRNSDIIRGYRADDSYFSFASAFLNNSISLPQLEKAMYLGRLGEQVVIKSERAFDNLLYEGSIRADRVVYYPRKTARDISARKEFREQRDSPSVENDVFVLDIMRERWENDDSRIQRIVLG